MISLVAQKRDTKETPIAVRRGGRVPAVFYGRKASATAVSVGLRDFLKVWKAAGESSIITLSGMDDEQTVLIQDVQQDPLSGKPIHVDFYVIEKDKKLKIKVPIEFTGSSPAVKDLGGILIKVMHELEIESLPKDLPQRVSIDLGGLVDFKSQMTAGDITLPEGVTLVNNVGDVVAAIAEPKEEEEQPSAPIDLSTIEVEKKGKEAAEGEEGEAAPALETGAKK
ncbi:MAG: hypothetical protein A2664_00440 [Candidatus Taylorbacteria bacterium RIFCSPHIGHO2_01_FULL_46_22b]|uniref:Large ribosomal subunit protein bL25 n=1 Tax=Candidatus Taylorbacteria bacterium RIFCSPHIGHO2_01_FULL_46_22b TaxID=1802301 RepID=A0A1G2M6L2_9BACT|nr:MAG: hypothetical protein A2664_00440 [Candidatus Taylorbacteria bacterium RIFCSPHIGHO2_01_FULL_46_22b]